MKRALAWIKANIAEHGGDPDFVVITGGSAGGHLCVARRAHAEPGRVPARLRGRRHVGRRRRPVLRRLRLHRTATAPAAPTWSRSSRSACSSRRSPTTGRAGSRRRRSATSVRTPRRSSCSTAPTTRSCPSSRPARSSTSSARRPRQPVAYAELPGAQHAFDIVPVGAGARHRPRRRALPRRGPQRAGRPDARRGGRRGHRRHQRLSWSAAVELPRRTRRSSVPTDRSVRPDRGGRRRMGREPRPRRRHRRAAAPDSWRPRPTAPSPD